MRIGVITTSYPRHPGDWAGAFVESSVLELLERGHEVDVIAAGDSSPAGRGVEVEVGARSGGASPSSSTIPLRVVRTAAPLAARVPHPLFYGQGAPETLEQGTAAAWIEAAGFCAELCDRIRSWSPSWDEAHAHWLVPSALLARAVGRPELAVRARAHSGDVALLERIPGGRMLAAWLARHLREITFASGDLELRFARLVAGPIRAHCKVAPASLLPLCVRDGGPSTAGEESFGRAIDSRRHGPPPAAQATSDSTVLSVGRLVPIKGFDVLVKALSLSQAGEAGIPGTRPPSLVILGDGPERERLRALATRLRVELHLPGFVSRGHVDRWMRAADVYVQPSVTLRNGRTEGLPTATLEALHRGLPIFAAETGGLAELPRSHPQVRLFRAGDQRALARLLMEHGRPSRDRRQDATFVSGA